MNVRAACWCSLSCSMLLGNARAQSDDQGLTAGALPRVAETQVESAPLAKAEDEPELDVLTFHRSTYALTGFTKDTQVKFQFSIKYDFWPSTGRHTVYFAYTQKSLWDLYNTSSPFRESNYAPELFYAHYHTDDHAQPGPGCGLFSEQVGLEHESNGEEGDASRSWNRAFVDVEATCYGSALYGVLNARAWYPFLLHENDTIIETQGYGELLFGIGIDHDNSHMNGLLSVAVRKGLSEELRKGSLTFDARWRPIYEQLLGKSWKFAPYAWVQYFLGYGETLGTFNEPSSSIRVGVGLTDRAR